jgi:hypothetical protein
MAAIFCEALFKPCEWLAEGCNKCWVGICKGCAECCNSCCESVLHPPPSASPAPFPYHSCRSQVFRPSMREARFLLSSVCLSLSLLFPLLFCLVSNTQLVVSRVAAACARRWVAAAVPGRSVARACSPSTHPLLACLCLALLGLGFCRLPFPPSDRRRLVRRPFSGCVAFSLVVNLAPLLACIAFLAGNWKNTYDMTSPLPFPLLVCSTYVCLNSLHTTHQTNKQVQ